MSTTIRPPALTGTVGATLNVSAPIVPAASTTAAIAAAGPSTSSFTETATPASSKQQRLFSQLQSDDLSTRTRAARTLHSNVSGDQTSLTAVRPLMEMLCRDSTNSLATRYAHDTLHQYGSRATGIFLQALQDPRPAMRALGATRLGTTRSRDAVAPLLNLLQSTEPINVQTACIAALAAICAHPSEPLSDSTFQFVISRLISIVRDDSTDDGIESLCMTMLEDLATRLRSRGCDTHVTRLSSFMTEMVHHKSNARVRLHAIMALQKIECVTPEVEAALVATLQDEDDIVFGAAAFAVGVLKISAAEESLLAFLQGDNPKRKLLSLAPLGQLGSRRATDLLMQQLDDSDAFVRKTAAEALGRVGDKRAIPALTRYRNDVDSGVRQTVHDAIAVIRYEMPWSLRHTLR